MIIFGIETHSDLDSATICLLTSAVSATHWFCGLFSANLGRFSTFLMTFFFLTLVFKHFCDWCSNSILHMREKVRVNMGSRCLCYHGSYCCAWMGSGSCSPFTFFSWRCANAGFITAYSLSTSNMKCLRDWNWIKCLQHSISVFVFMGVAHHVSVLNIRAVIQKLFHHLHMPLFGCRDQGRPAVLWDESRAACHHGNRKLGHCCHGNSGGKKAVLWML